MNRRPTPYQGVALPTVPHQHQQIILYSKSEQKSIGEIIFFMLTNFLEKISIFLKKGVDKLIFICYNIKAIGNTDKIKQMRVCWNWQTGTFEGRVSTDVWVQVPLLAPIKRLPNGKRFFVFILQAELIQLNKKAFSLNKEKAFQISQ